MREQLAAMREESLQAVEQAASKDELNALRLRYMGKKGELTNVLKGLGKVDPSERKALGQLANELKQAFEKALDIRRQALLETETVLDRPFDLTLPGLFPEQGGLHPITQMSYDLNDAFRSLNFELYAEDEISSELYAFDHLNFPPEHPARESMDTYWLAGTENKRGAERLCLRPHLTGGSVRYLQQHGAPARFVYPGRVFRNETTDARHERAFYQYEALIVEKDYSFSSGLLLVNTILKKVFATSPSGCARFLPFVEPGFGSI